MKNMNELKNTRPKGHPPPAPGERAATVSVGGGISQINQALVSGEAAGQADDADRRERSGDGASSSAASGSFLPRLPGWQQSPWAMGRGRPAPPTVPAQPAVAVAAAHAAAAMAAWESEERDVKELPFDEECEEEYEDRVDVSRAGKLLLAGGEAAGRSSSSSSGGSSSSSSSAVCLPRVQRALPLPPRGLSAQGCRLAHAQGLPGPSAGRPLRR